MRRSSLLPLAIALRFCWGRQAAFSVHDDLLAHPQFEVLFSDKYISEREAQALLEAGSSSPSESELSIIQQTGHPGAQESPDFDDHAFEREVSETYELINMHPRKYLCAIPVIESPPPHNQTATELAKAEEARELSRATVSGWQLIRDLEGKCLYFVSGWWSYQFCFGGEVIQYHAIQTVPKDGIPIRDPNVEHYILGRDLDSIDPDDLTDPHRYAEVNPDAGELADVPRNTELVLKGNQRYLIQRLDDGTICDLTGRPRTIEIQYHCAIVGKADRIAWIKEVTTCSYLMAIYTPRLCRDIAFLPPKPTKAHSITCREILAQGQEEAWQTRKTLEMESKNPKSVFQKYHNEVKPVTVGGIVVGSRSILGAADHDGQEARLMPPRGFGQGAQKTATVVIARGQSIERGGTVEALPDEDISALKLDPDVVGRVRSELHKYAGRNAWRLELVQGNGAAELVAIVISGNDEERLGVVVGDDSNSKTDDGGGAEEHWELYNGEQGQKKIPDLPPGKQEKAAANDDKQKHEDDAEEHKGSQEELFERPRDEL